MTLRVTPERTAKVARSRTGATGSRSTVAAELGEEDREVFERLRAWRTEQAREQGVPAYVVFPDATLIELARARPSSSAALAEVSGVGAKKLERYGEAVLRVLA